MRFGFDLSRNIIALLVSAFRAWTKLESTFILLRFVFHINILDDRCE